MSITYGFLIFGLVLLPCEIGQQLTNTFDEINFEFEELRWYLLAIEIRQMLPTAMMFAQESVIFHCYGVIFCSRHQLKMVIQSNSMKQQSFKTFLKYPKISTLGGPDCV